MVGGESMTKRWLRERWRLVKGNLQMRVSVLDAVHYPTKPASSEGEPSPSHNE
jgi:hypothetical protein